MAKPNITPELLKLIKRQDEDLFFVTTNRSLYPFANWIPNQN